MNTFGKIIGGGLGLFGLVCLATGVVVPIMTDYSEFTPNDWTKFVINEVGILTLSAVTLIGSKAILELNREVR